MNHAYEFQPTKRYLFNQQIVVSTSDTISLSIGLGSITLAILTIFATLIVRNVNNSCTSPSLYSINPKRANSHMV